MTRLPSSGLRILMKFWWASRMYSYVWAGWRLENGWKISFLVDMDGCECLPGNRGNCKNSLELGCSFRASHVEETVYACAGWGWKHISENLFVNHILITTYTSSSIYADKDSRMSLFSLHIRCRTSCLSSEAHSIWGQRTGSGEKF